METIRPNVAASTPSPATKQRDLQPDAMEAIRRANPSPWNITYPADHTRPMRFVHPLPPRDIARILGEAGYDEPVDVPSKREQITATAAIWLAVGTVGYFALQFLRGAL